MKKKIFITVYYMEIGGVERSLLGLLDSFDYTRYAVDLFIHKHTGEFLPLIPKEVNLLPENKKYATFSRPIKDLFLEGHFLIGIARLRAKLKTFIFNKKNNFNENASSFLYITKFTSKYLPSLFNYGTYDLAISFIAPHNIVLEKVKATKKIAWIHTDYSYIDLDINMEKPIWSKFDYIASISESVTTNFLKKFPLLKPKIILIENILSSDFIQKQAKKENISNEIPNTKEIKLCSVGRFGNAKNFDNAVYICKKLIKMGLNIKWYIIGYGSDENKIRTIINKTNMEDFFILLGKKTNPYPYIQACDFYIQPSRYEGKAVTVREAQILGKPVIITNFPTANSQLKNRIDGVIVPMDNNGAAKGIYNFILNKEKQKEIIKNVNANNYSNEMEINKIYKLLK